MYKNIRRKKSGVKNSIILFTITWKIIIQPVGFMENPGR
jgi:hypothetical protein